VRASGADRTPMTITAAIHSTEDALRQEVLLDGRHTIVVDEPEALGGTDTAPTPFELLAASLAGCVAVTIRMYARRKDWDLTDLRVEAELDKEARPPRFRVTVHLPDGLTEEQHARLEHIAQACPVHRMLKDELCMDHRIVSGASAGA
jgi:putative redox protein